MDVELKKLMDETMQIMHQISWWIIEWEKVEINETLKEKDGKVIPRERIVNNKITKKLFENLQEKYDLIQKKIAERAQELKEDYKQSDSIKTETYTENLIINELEEYVDNSYVQLRYIPYRIGNNRKEYPSIYEGTPFEQIILAENSLEHANLEQLGKRIYSLKNRDNFSFEDQSEVLHCMSRRRFYEDYAFTCIDTYIDNMKMSKNDFPDDVYLATIEKLIEQKYMHYFTYMNHKYNDFIRIKDTDKFDKVRIAIEEGMESVTLNMSEFEYNSNLDYFTQNMKALLNAEIKRMILSENLQKYRKSLRHTSKTDEFDIEEK